MSEQASEMEDATELDQFNKKLENKNAYLLVRKDGTIVYTGSDDDRVKAVIEQLRDMEIQIQHRRTEFILAEMQKHW